MNKINGYDVYAINHPVSKEGKEKWCPNDLVCYPDTFCGRYAMGDYAGFFLGNDDKNKFYFIDGAQGPSV